MWSFHGIQVVCPKSIPLEGPSKPITTAMVRKTINMMSLGKAAGPSDIIAEMLKATGPSGVNMIREPIEDIIFEYRLNGRKVT